MLGILISNIIYIIYHKNIYIQWSLYIGTSPHLGWSLAGTTDPHFSILHWPQSSQSVLTTTPGQQIVQGLLLSSGFCLKTTSSLWINFYQCRGWCSIFITSFLLKIMVQPSENPWKNASNCPRNHPYLHGSLCFLLRSRTGFRNSEKDLVLNQQKFVNDEIFCTFSLKTM